ncbi:hypothetical protein KAH55_09865, partial [bacterium]|nr:hypothetical protein [bacterium]
MNKMNKVLSIFFVLIGCSSGSIDAKAAHCRWDYDIQYRGVVTSDLSIEIIEDAMGLEGARTLIRCETHNKGAFQRLFHVKNQYETQIIPSQNGLPLFLKKIINQKNIQQEW